MHDMMQSDEFREYLAKLAGHLSDHCIYLLNKNKLTEHKATHDIMDRVLKFPLVLSKNREKTEANPKVRLCVQSAIALAESRHLKKKLAGILKEFDDEPET